jgi:hypothetical protein
MKPAVAHREVHSSGALNEGKFGISTADQVHILSILRDRLYTNKVLAVLREYSSNAWDAHREVGKHDVPIRVGIPTYLNPELIIRDYGPGLSEEDIFEVYVKYGASTKRSTNEAVGMLGIGAKSAFAYSDQFTVTSWNGGTKKVYIAALDETNVGTMTKLHEESCPPEETGIEIKVPVDPKDIRDFEREAVYLFPFFNPQPVINIDLEEKIGEEKKNGFLRKAGEAGHLPNWVAVMGCVPYNLNFLQLGERLEDEKVELHRVLRGGLRFDIGDVDIGANREELEYTERTKQAIVSKLKALGDELWDDLKATLTGLNQSWEKRLAVRDLIFRLGMKAPDYFAAWRALDVPLYKTKTDDEGITTGQPNTFRIHTPKYNGKRWTLSRTVNVRVSEHAKIIIRDSAKPMRGHLDMTEMFRVVTMIPRMSDGGMPSWDEVEAEVRKLVDDAGLTGIPIRRISEWEYTPVSYYRNGGTKSPKHTRKVFRLADQPWTHPDKESDNWELTSSVMDASDVFVRLHRFKPVRFHSFIWDHYNRDKTMLWWLFGVPMPTIYGVKTTDKRPVREEDVNGVHYLKWLQDFVEGEAKDSDEVKRILDTWFWYRLARKVTVPGDEAMKLLKERLDGRHSIIRFYAKLTAARAEQKSWHYDRSTAIKRYLNLRDQWHRKRYREAEQKGLKRLPKIPSHVSSTARNRIYQKYPLLSSKNGGPGIDVFLGNHADAWLDYINLIDNS